MDISHHWNKVHAMSIAELEKYAEDRQVDLSVREFANADDLADYICEQCGVARPRSAKSARKSVVSSESDDESDPATFLQFAEADVTDMDREATQELSEDEDTSWQDEIHRLLMDYMKEHNAPFAEALQAVLAANPDLAAKHNAYFHPEEEPLDRVLSDEGADA